MSNVGGGEWNEIDWVVETAQKEGTINHHRFEDWYIQHQTQKEMEEETKRISTMHRQMGRTKGHTMKRIMSMPLHIFKILRQIDPEFGRNTPEGKNKVYRFLSRHPMFRVR